MKILVIICAHDICPDFSSNLTILNDYLKTIKNCTQIDYCGICNHFDNYNDVVSLKYKIINHKKQFCKICDFISENRTQLNYDWFIKIRPDTKLLQPINFLDVVSDKAINARARVYYGPKRIKYGMSINGEGRWKNVGDCFFDADEKDVILDDAMFIFHRNVVDLGAFDKVEPVIHEDEWRHTSVWKERNINLNVIGINLVNIKYDVFSGDVNM